MRDCVLNRSLIDRTTNQIDQRPRALAVSWRRSADTQGFPFEAVLASHCLPTGRGLALLDDDYGPSSPGGRRVCGRKSSA